MSRADACARELPPLTAIPPAPDLGGRLTKLADLQSSVRSLDGAVHDWGRAVGCGHDGLRALAARCHDEMEWAAKTAGTWLSHVRDQADDPLLARDWAFVRCPACPRTARMRSGCAERSPPTAS